VMAAWWLLNVAINLSEMRSHVTRWTRTLVECSRVNWPGLSSAEMASLAPRGDSYQANGSFRPPVPGSGIHQGSPALSFGWS
jgi:hypothetical protein